MSVFKNKNSGKWDAEARYVDWQGNSQRKHKRGFETKREALAWEREFSIRQSDDLDMNFADFVKTYEEDRRPRLKLNTWLSKEYIINDKLIPYFGKLAMNEIDAKAIVRWQNTLISYRDTHGKPYAQTYLKTIHNQLTAIFTHAHKLYGLKVNPASKAGSMGKKNAKEMKFWTLAQYTEFSKSVMHDPRLFYAFEVLYWCGIRFGELRALTPKDFDFEKGTLRINKSVQIIKGKEEETEPKTPKSNRIILMPKLLCSEMKEYFALHYELKPNDRVFKVSKSNLAYHLKTRCPSIGLDKIRVHDLRHSHVSLLIDLGFSAVAIADRTGHESIEITLRYAHMFPSRQGEIASVLNFEMEKLSLSSHEEEILRAS